MYGFLAPKTISVKKRYVIKCKVKPCLLSILSLTYFASLWNAKLTYIQIFVPIFKYLDLGTNHLYLSSNYLYLASNHLHLGTNDLKIGINDLYLGSNDLY